jgi:hypothetical protein
MNTNTGLWSVVPRDPTFHFEHSLTCSSSPVLNGQQIMNTPTVRSNAPRTDYHKEKRKDQCGAIAEAVKVARPNYSVLKQALKLSNENSNAVTIGVAGIVYILQILSFYYCLHTTLRCCTIHTVLIHILLIYYDIDENSPT